MEGGPRRSATEKPLGTRHASFSMERELVLESRRRHRQRQRR
jgi:hypothetical protein